MLPKRRTILNQAKTEYQNWAAASIDFNALKNQVEAGAIEVKNILQATDAKVASLKVFEEEMKGSRKELEDIIRKAS